MKKLLLLCSALTLALAGCNSAPDGSELQSFLEPKFASCKNIKLVDIKKTNGYEEDGYYHMQFTYGIELKDVDQLKAIKEVWLQEKERAAQAKKAYEERDQQIAALRQQIKALEKESAPNYDQFEHPYLDRSQGRPDADSFGRQQRYAAALNEWRRNPPENLRQKQEELKAYEQDFREKWGGYNYQVLGNTELTVSHFYRQGCSGTSSKFTEGMLLNHAKIAQQSKDLSEWFEVREIQMNGSVMMRKTKNGWRALSDR